jgi:hypothetical protein
MARSSAVVSPEGRPLPIRLRSSRLRRADERHPRRGDIVLRAHVIAKLLGLRLLTLDAEVLIDSYSDLPIAPTETATATQELGELPHRPSRTGRSDSGIAQAMELLEQSDSVLESCVRHRRTLTAW